MPVVNILGRRHCIPIIYVKGTHYEIGYDIGRTFKSLIQSFVNKSGQLNNEYLPAYNTISGRIVYENTLASVRINFPQYVAEIDGTADGACVPFHKLFLLAMDDITTNCIVQPYVNNKPTGCSSICLNESGNEILGHTEDALSDVLNFFYIVSAHIISNEPIGKWNVREEKFTSLCYAGHLPGYTMGFNYHGLVYSINTLSVAKILFGRTPRTFLARALLSAENSQRVSDILLDEGCGTADGFSVNMRFFRDQEISEFFNIEVGPNANSINHSQLNTLKINPGEYTIHCNTYLRLPIVESTGFIIDSSEERLRTLKKYGRPSNKKDIINMLSDQSGEKYKVFQESGTDDFVKTIAVGIFDFCKYTWSLYADKPSCNDPLVIIPLKFKQNKKHTTE